MGSCREKPDRKCQNRTEQRHAETRTLRVQEGIAVRRGQRRQRSSRPRVADAPYWLIGRRPWQVASLPIAAPVGCTRTTASSNEQKLRVPDWFRVIGTAVA